MTEDVWALWTEEKDAALCFNVEEEKKLLQKSIIKGIDKGESIGSKPA